MLAVTQAVLAAAAANVMTALPAHAVAGKIFDFNATLPIMVTEFLLLMVFLEKFWFTPVGDNLDQRDKYIRDKLASVKVSPATPSTDARRASLHLRLSLAGARNTYSKHSQQRAILQPATEHHAPFEHDCPSRTVSCSMTCCCDWA